MTCFRLWKEVTYNLKNKNIEVATEHKQRLEQRQRNEAKERKEKGLKVETKVGKNSYYIVLNGQINETTLSLHILKVVPYMVNRNCNIFLVFLCPCVWDIKFYRCLSISMST